MYENKLSTRFLLGIFARLNGYDRIKTPGDLKKAPKRRVIFRMKEKILNMFIIAGLGNPGKEYENTRHNAGFMVLDALADKLGADISEKKHKALCGRAVIGGQKVILLKPQTFMNSSGESIRAAADYYKVEPEDILVVYDDIHLAPGQLRIRAKGSAGGHNGMKSIIAHLGTQEFPRVRVGVGEKPPRMDLVDYVLGHFSQSEKKIMEDAAKEAADAVAEAVTEGIEHAMNDHNRKRED